MNNLYFHFHILPISCPYVCLALVEVMLGTIFGMHSSELETRREGERLAPPPTFGELLNKKIQNSKPKWWTAWTTFGNMVRQYRKKEFEEYTKLRNLREQLDDLTEAFREL